MKVAAIKNRSTDFDQDPLRMMQTKNLFLQNCSDFVQMYVKRNDFLLLFPPFFFTEITNTALQKYWFLLKVSKTIKRTLFFLNKNFVQSFGDYL